MKPFVSVIIPCRNEVAFLPRCLDSIRASDYPAERLEIVVADGMSSDGTRELLRNDPRVRLVDNPARITPVALNRAIAASRGSVIVRLDAHSAIAPDYISRAVEHLETSGADNVGGRMRTVARDSGVFAPAIELVLTHRFGVGNSDFRTLSEGAGPKWVDTVFGGCWRRKVFERVGLFNERLVRSQDIEFNLRLRRAGGRILLAPDLRSDYFARAELGSFVRHNWSNGAWAVLPFAYSEIVPVRWRHLAPLAFVCALCASLALAWAGWTWPLALAAGPYLAANLLTSFFLAWRERSARLAVLLPVAFASLHLPYGAGALWGAMQWAAIALSRVWHGRSSLPAEPGKHPT